jgi:thiol:disulfide interchange protein
MRRILIILAVVLLILAFAARRMRPQQAPASAATIYNEHADARHDVAAALANAHATHRYVLLDFGANWCGDCQMLDLYMHDPANAALLARGFVPVHINVCRFDCNTDLAAQYGVPLKHGIPALSVVDADGHVLFAQSAGEFSDMRHLESSALTAFLRKWSPPAR